MIGSVDHVQQTWLWSWANDTLPQAVLGDITDVRRHGEEHTFPLFGLAEIPCRAEAGGAGQDRRCRCADPEELWFEPGDEIGLHFVIHYLRRV